MPRRNIVFASNEVYHIYNRSIADEKLFVNQQLIARALQLFEFYRYPQKISFSQFCALDLETRTNYVSQFVKQPVLVELFAFALMPSHYHILIKQISTRGITRFISNFQNSFAKYFNIKKERHGGLFQNQFKANRVENDDQLVHLSRYIHLNPVTSYKVELDQLPDCVITSYPYYHGIQKDNLVNSKYILNIFGDRERYFQFISNQKDYQRELSRIKHLID